MDSQTNYSSLKKLLEVSNPEKTITDIQAKQIGKFLLNLYNLNR
ncbi:MAG: hypothetical protein Q4A36_01215 [Candidatus Saccharibacteria bacterium]|nr:hypothetical protein [Candidatus Saccharibacteria bacterium]